MKSYFCAIVVLLVLLMASTAGFGQTTSGYKVVDKVKIGGEGGWDYLITDPVAQRLYVSHATRVIVIDTKTNTVVGEISPTNGVHGIALAPSLDRGFTSNGRDSSVTVFELKSLKIVATIKLQARNPDAILFDPFSSRVFTFNGGSSSATAIDAKSLKVVGAVPLAGKPEFAVTDLKGKIFVNIEDKSQVTMFDPNALKVLAEYPLAPGEEPSGLAFDRQHQRLFSVCGNSKMVVMDATNGKVVATLPTGPRTDAAGFDPKTGFAFASNGDGTLTVIHEESPDKFIVVENVPTQQGSRTMAFDEVTHRIYLSGALFGPTPAPTTDRPRPRPAMEPGSFMVLVLDRK